MKNANVKSPAKATVNKVIRVTATKKAIQVTTKKEKINYLSEGVTGKQVMKAIYEANNRHKKDLGSLSQCLKRAIEFGTEDFTKTIKGFNVKDCTPKNLVPLRSVKNASKETFSVYEVLMLIKKYYQTK
jgi:hypothetical protein